ncbi:MAG: DUF4173 domain-containing protein [Sediminibacterium sp.]|nr:DUF4173 domain-containing protein [Sediminibacterium sp.]
MKRYDWLILSGTALFSVLFYNQSAGINFLLFSVFVVSSLGAMNRPLLKSKTWWYYTFCHLLTAFFVFYHSSALSIFAWIVSLLVLAANSIHLHQSIIVKFFLSAYTLISSFVFVILNSIAKSEENKDVTRYNRIWKRALSFSIALGLVFIFFGLYRAANPLFKDLTKDITFPDFNLSWCFFTLWGFLMVYGLLKMQTIKAITSLDTTMNRDIEPKDNYKTYWLDEKLVAGFAFGVLNIMLLILNGLDIHQLFIKPALPVSVTLSDFVHQAIAAIITSIILAMVFIMICYRGELNFNPRYTYIKWLVYAWIAQSIVMVISAMVRNNWYVNAYALTHLRIGVYVYLIMAIAGLVLTAYKLYTFKSGWQLTRANTEVWFLWLCLSTSVDWDKLITNYNLYHKTGSVQTDMDYLMDLSDSSLPELLLHHPFSARPALKEAPPYYFQTGKISYKLYIFCKDYENQDWQSFSMRSHHIYNSIQDLNRKKLITHLELNNWPIESLKPLQFLSNLDYLSMRAENLKTEELKSFQSLRYLTLLNPKDDQLSALKDLQHLNYLCLWGDYLSSLKYLSGLKKLELLKLKYINQQDYTTLKQLKNLRTIYIEHITEEALKVLRDELPTCKIIKTTTNEYHNR